MRPAALPAFLLAPLLALAATTGPAPVREVRVLMGTSAEVQAGGLEAPLPAIDAAFAALARVDDAMSLWKPSELSRLNDAGTASVSADVARVLECALDVARASEGAFDPTVEPLVRATGGLGGPRRTLSAEERKRLLARVGHARVTLDPASRQVTLAAGSRLDFGGIAKGYAVDLAMEALRQAGATQALVDLGGSSVSVAGVPLDVVVRDPEDAEKDPWARFELSGLSLSSSGGDQKPAHILDPRTGQPARHVLGATVVAASAMEADALSTAVFVLGADRGLKLLAERGAAGFVLLRERGRRIIRATRGFGDAHAMEPAPGVWLREEP